MTIPVPVSVKSLLVAATAAVKGDPVFDVRSLKTLQAYVIGTGAVTATVLIEGSNFGVEGTYITLGTITLTGTTIATDGFVHDAPWGFIRAELTAISGTGAAVSAALGN